MSKENRQGKNPTDAIKILWEEGFFKLRNNLSTIDKELISRGNNFSSAQLSKAVSRARFLNHFGKCGAYEYAQKLSAVSVEIEKIGNDLFSDELVKILKKDFKYELEDLKLNFGKSGNCTAFLLRKILEKLIYITFAKNDIVSKLEDKTRIGKFVGLEAMLNIASSEKIKGTPFLMPKTAEEIKGMKFLGDTSAHNPLVEVDMKTIISQIPFIITAYKELAKKL